MSSTRESPPLAKVILIIDDDKETREATAELLLDMGYFTMAARGGHDALKLFSHGLVPAIMLVDLEMPDMNGEEFCTRCNEIPAIAAVPKVFVSGAVEPNGLRQRTGAHGFLAKPILDRHILAVLAGYDIHPAPATVR